MKAKRLIALLTAIVAVGNASATTIAAAETASAASTQTLYGDANLDGKINVSDAVAVLQFIANQMKYALKDQGKINADLIDPGQGITGLDAVAIQMIDAQLIKTEDLPMTADELKNGKKTDKPSDTPEPTQEQLELMKKNPLVVIDSETNKPFIYGALNGDMKLDDKDLTLLNKLITDEAKYNPVADLDGDGTIDVYDAEWLEDYINKEAASFPAYEKYDSDGDRLSDYAETEELKTDRMNRDTDGDGLSDLEELYMTGTDPLKKFSVSETVSDSDLDPDEDGLTNIEEVKVNSDPNNKDTDRDGFDDGYEVNTLKTSPVMTDTDEDGLSDWEEVVDMKEFNLDATKKATNGTPDNQRTFKQVINADDPVLSEINTEENGYKLSLELTASGCAKNHIIVRNSRYTDYMKSGAAMGAVPEIIYDDDLVLTDITLKFEIDEEFRESVLYLFSDTYNDIGTDEYDGIKRLNLFKYFEVIDEEMPIDTFYDEPNNIVYVTLTSDIFEECDAVEGINVGSYSLVDLEVWGAIMNSYFEEEEVENTEAASTGADAMMYTGSASILADKSNDKPAPSGSILKRILENYISIGKCVPGYEDTFCNPVYFGGNYYSLTLNKAISWEDAKKKCEDAGGHLATITSETEQKFIEQLISADDTLNYIWIGGSNCDESENAWKWLTGEKWSYDNWYTGQPDNGLFDGLKEDRLGIIVDTPDGPYKWNDFTNVGSTVKMDGYIIEWESLNDYIKGCTGKENKTVERSNRGPYFLNGPVSKDSGIDTDTDGLVDYDELNSKLLNFVFKNASSKGRASWSQILNAISDKYKRNITSDSQSDKVNELAKKTSKNPKATTVSFIGAEAYQWLGDPTQADEDNDYLTGEDDKDNPRGFDPTPVDARIIDDSNMFSNKDKGLKHLISEYDNNEQQIAPAGTILTQAKHPGDGRAAVKTLGNPELGDEVEKIEISYKRESYYNKNEGTAFSIRPTEDNDYELAIKFESKAQADIALNQKDFITIKNGKGKLLDKSRIHNYISSADENVLICHFSIEANKTYTIKIINLFIPPNAMECTIYQDNWVYAPYGAIRVSDDPDVPDNLLNETYIAEKTIISLCDRIFMDDDYEYDIGDLQQLVNDYKDSSKYKSKLKTHFEHHSKLVTDLGKRLHFRVEFPGLDEVSTTNSIVQIFIDDSTYEVIGDVTVSELNSLLGNILTVIELEYKIRRWEFVKSLVKGELNICLVRSNLDYGTAGLIPLSEYVAYSASQVCLPWDRSNLKNGVYISRYTDSIDYKRVHCAVVGFNSYSENYTSGDGAGHNR